MFVIAHLLRYQFGLCVMRAKDPDVEAECVLVSD